MALPGGCIARLRIEGLNGGVCTLQAAYPPNHYIRSVPQRKVHMFTAVQLIQLAIMCAVGFSPFPYMKMVFPVFIFLLLPTRYTQLVFRDVIMSGWFAWEYLMFTLVMKQLSTYVHVIR